MQDTSDGISRRGYLSGAGAVGATALAGCSGLTGGGSEAITVAYMPIYPDMQYFVMEQEGYFEELPVEVDARRFSDGPSIVQWLCTR